MTDRGTSLRMLVKHLGVQRAWRTFDGKRAVVHDETLVEVLRLLGVPVAGRDDAADWLARILAAERDRIVEPVTVLWDGAPLRLAVVLPTARAHDDFTFHVATEHGEVAHSVRRECRVGTPRREGSRHVTFIVEPPTRLAYGVHRIGIEVRGGPTAWGVVIAAPAHLGDPPPGEARRWGVFAPLHALHAQGRASGDFALLDRLSQWAAQAGAHAMGLLPILAAYVGNGREPCEANPYAPVSRRFWNEHHLDLAAVPEVDRASLATLDGSVRNGALVDPRAVAAVRRPLLEAAVVRLDGGAGSSSRRVAFESWCEQHPDVSDYAAFRATVEARGPIAPGAPLAGDPRAVRYHQYAQWLVHDQLAALGGRCRERRQVLSFELPIGVHPQGFDVWQRPDHYLVSASVGAPPDEHHPGGQTWGTPPRHPHAARLAGHAEFRADLRTHFAVAPWLRIEHVAGLRRLWVVPGGADAATGAYLTYPADELYAMLCLEATRARGVESEGGVVAGENLGTVPHETNRALQSHRMLGCYVAQFETDDAGLRAPGRRSVATLDTHDTPTFAQWWRGLDPVRRGAVIDQLRADGVLDTEIGETLDTEAVLNALLTQLGASRAEIVMVALEDLWLETEPQNRPGDRAAAPANFRHRAARSLDELERDGSRLDLLRNVDQVRRRGLLEV